MAYQLYYINSSDDRENQKHHDVAVVSSKEEAYAKLEELDKRFEQWEEEMYQASQKGLSVPPLPPEIEGYEGCDVFLRDLETGKTLVNQGDDIWVPDE